MSGFVCVKLSWSAISGGSGASLDQVDECEDRDPDHVDEVPVERGDVDQERVLRLEPALRRFVTGGLNLICGSVLW